MDLEGEIAEALADAIEREAAGSRYDPMRESLDLASRSQGNLAAVVAAIAQYSFWEWPVKLGLIVDRRQAFTYDGYEFLKPIYQSIPSPDPDEELPPTYLPRAPELRNYNSTIMKASQCGASIFALTMVSNLSLRIPGFSTTYFLPDEASALKMSSERFMELIRPNPDLYRVLQDSNPGTQRGEGAKSLRRFASAFIFFGYLGGSMQTESMPLDCLVFDEVQLMTPSQMEKARERVAASRWKITQRLSTATLPDSDIHWFFQQSDQRYWHTRCRCGGKDEPDKWVVLSEIWPNCIGQGNGSTPGVPRGYFYRCPRCDTVIEHTRRGRYVQHAPENFPHVGWHFSQTLLPTLSAGDMIRKFEESRDLANFYNRSLGKPYQAEDKIPVSMELLRSKVYREDLDWLVSPGRQLQGGLMGVDHMGAFSVVWILARSRDNTYRTVWVELIEGVDNFDRIKALMDEYGVSVCCIENTPNYNEARRLAREFYGRVFIVDYGQLMGEMVIWKDKARANASQQRTDPDEDVPFIARVEQFRLMSYALGMVGAGLMKMPHPEKHPLMVRASKPPFVANKAAAAQVNIADHAARHLTRIALITQEVTDPLNPQKKTPIVQKIGYDPHFAYAYMLAVLASVRAYGTAQLLDLHFSPLDSVGEFVRGEEARRVPTDKGMQKQMADLVQRVKDAAPKAPLVVESKCGTCANRAEGPGPWFRCAARTIQVRAGDAACDFYQLQESAPVPQLGDIDLEVF